MLDWKPQKGIKADRDGESGLRWGGWLIMAIASPDISSIIYELFENVAT